MLPETLQKSKEGPLFRPPQGWSVYSVSYHWRQWILPPSSVVDHSIPNLMLNIGSWTLLLSLMESIWSHTAPNSRRRLKAFILCLAAGNFTALTVTFPFKRRMGYYIIQVYIPCVFLVMLSWIVFWMRPDDSASRLTVGITTILTIVFLLGYTNGMLPKVRAQRLKRESSEVELKVKKWEWGGVEDCKFLRM